jgi:hypothetical protein
MTKVNLEKLIAKAKIEREKRNSAETTPKVKPDPESHPNFKHGLIKTRLYSIYRKMKNRCYNSGSEDYKGYGGRGIIICQEWLNDFRVFHKWALENGYADDLSIDRIDVHGNYTPSNCKWSTPKEQAVRIEG